MTSKNTTKGLVPIEQVLDDMYQDKGIVSKAARDYYKVHYATKEERIDMDKQERRECVVSLIFLCSVGIGILCCIINSVF